MALFSVVTVVHMFRIPDYLRISVVSVFVESRSVDKSTFLSTAVSLSPTVALMHHNYCKLTSPETNVVDAETSQEQCVTISPPSPSPIETISPPSPSLSDSISLPSHSPPLPPLPPVCPLPLFPESPQLNTGKNSQGISPALVINVLDLSRLWIMEEQI